MLRNLLRNKKYISLRKHHALPPRMDQPIIKKAGNFDRVDLIDYKKQDFYNKNTFQVNKSKEIREKIINKIKNKNKSEIKYPEMPESYIKSIYENFEYDDETGIIKNVCFEEEIKIIKNLKNVKIQKFEQFQSIIQNMVKNLSLLNEYEVLQFQKHSVALRISSNFTDQAKGILLKLSLEDIIQKKFKDEEEKNLTIKNLVEKIALKMVYNKIEEIIQKKQKGTSYERNDVLDFFLKDPLYEPNGIMIKKVISQIYYKSTDFSLDTNKEFLESDENKIKLKIQENYFRTRARYICEFLKLNVDDYYDFDGYNESVNYPNLFKDIAENKIQEFDSNSNHFETIHVQLQKILGHFEVNNDLNSKITLLEKSLKTFNKDLPAIDVIAKQLNLLIHELPEEIKSKYFNSEAEGDYKYINRDFNIDSLQWKNLDLEIPSSIMPVDYLKESRTEKDKRNKVLLLKEAHTSPNDTEMIIKNFEYDTKQEFYDNSDLEIEESLTERVNNNFPDALHIKKTQSDEELSELFVEKEQDLLRTIERKEQDFNKNFGKLTKTVSKEESLNPAYKNFILKDVSNEFLSFVGEMKEIHESEIENEKIKKGRKKNVLKKHREGIQKRVSDMYSKNRFSKNIHEDIFTNDSNKFDLDPDMVKPTLEKWASEKHDDTYEETNFEYNIQMKRAFKLDIKKKKSFRKKEVFEINENNKETQEKISLSDNYQYALEFYKEFNSSLFYKHYITENFKNTNKFNPNKTIDKLKKEDDPNIGLYLDSDPLNSTESPTSPLTPSLKTPIDPLFLQEETNTLLSKYFPESELASEKLKKNFFGKGRRKKAKAVAILQIPGTGKITINKREFSEYFFNSSDRYHFIKPLIAAGLECKVDVKLFVYGSGLSKQSEAGKVALAKAVVKAFPEFEKHFFDLYLMFTDDRRVERKKTGRPKARKGVTYV